jgi:hypothetical protein
MLQCINSSIEPIYLITEDLIGLQASNHAVFRFDRSFIRL